MRRRRAPFSRAASAAHEVLSLRGIHSPEDIDLEALAADHGIAVRRAPIANAEGRLVRSGRHGVITIDEGAWASEKWRFVLAHELGHFILHALRNDLACFPKKGASREERSRSFLDEEAASGFASVLLLPDALVRMHWQAEASPLERAMALASRFNVSPPTAALRTLDFTEDPCAVVYIEGGKIAWSTATRAFGVKVPDRIASPSPGPEGKARSLAASRWGRPEVGVDQLVEQSVSLAPFDARITMLWHTTQA